MVPAARTAVFRHPEPCDMSTEYSLFKENDTEISVIESSCELEFTIYTKKDGEVYFSFSEGLAQDSLTRRFTAEEMVPIIVKLARAASYCSEDSEEYLEALAKKITTI
jgi:hypothetical protein